MKRTQIYLDESLLRDLKARAREQGTTVSDLVRQAVRAIYPVPASSRRKAMEAFVGLWRERTDLPDTESYVRSLRRDRTWRSE